MTPEEEHSTIVFGLAAFATSLAEMGVSEADFQVSLAAQLARLRVTDPDVLDEAASAIAHMPQPLEESAAETERMEPIRQMLGVQSAAEQLAAGLQAREWLRSLAELLRSSAS